MSNTLLTRVVLAVPTLAAGALLLAGATQAASASTAAVGHPTVARLANIHTDSFCIHPQGGANCGPILPRSPW